MHTRWLLAVPAFCVLAACSQALGPTPVPTTAPTAASIPPTRQPSFSVTFTATLAPTATSTATATPAASPTATATATPDPMSQAPEIEALVSEAANGVVIYRAVAANPYGLSEGEYAGQYRPNVVVEGASAGAVVLAPTVASYILSSQLAQITDPDDRWLIPLPVDISEASGAARISVITERARDYPTTVIGIRVSERLPVTYVIPDSDKARVLRTESEGWAVLDSSVRTSESCATRICAGQEMYYLIVYGPFQGYTDPVDIPVEFGQSIATISGTLRVSMASGYEARDLSVDKILAIDGKVVFVASK
jgi:hypothetical protein